MKPINELMYIKVRRDIHSFAEVLGLFGTARNLGYRVAKGVPKGFTCGGYIINHKEKVIRGIATPHTFYNCNHREATVYEAIESIRHHAQEKNMEPRPHAELIKAWADGAEIQVRGIGIGGGKWVDRPRPTWQPSLEYRIKPVERVYHAAINRFNGEPSSMICFSPDDTGYRHIKPHLKLVMDDEGKLISAEVI